MERKTMEQSPLLRRFQGALMGTVVGESVAQMADPWDWMAAIDPPASGAVCWGDGLWATGQSWLEGAAFSGEAALRSVRWEDWLEATIGLIPQILLGHEQPWAFGRVVRPWAARWGITSIEHPGIWLAAGVFSLGLRQPVRLWGQAGVIGPVLEEWLRASGSGEAAQTAAIAEGGSSATLDTWLGHLQQLQTWLEQSRSLLAVQQGLRSQRLDPSTQQGLLVLYCVLSLPDDFATVLGRVLAVVPQGRSACALAGGLAGAYRTVAEIPWQWRSAVAAGWDPARGDRLAADLLLAWAGVDRRSGYPERLPLVTAPRSLNLQRIRG